MQYILTKEEFEALVPVGSLKELENGLNLARCAFDALQKAVDDLNLPQEERMALAIRRKGYLQDFLKPCQEE